MQADEKQRRRIVVGVDGSEPSQAALRWSLAEAEQRAARVEAVIAWRPSASVAPPAGRPSASTCTIQERHADAEAIVERELREAGPPGVVETQARVMRGSPYRVLLDAARGAELLVIGGSSGKLGGKLPWSTGQQLVREAMCPVVVVPARAARELGTCDREQGLRGRGAAAGHAGGGTPAR